MTLEHKLEAKKRIRKVLDAEIKFIQAQIDHKNSKPKVEKAAELKQP
jgi:CII-binding regulator of phage lambda lysogenization HflD